MSTRYTITTAVILYFCVRRENAGGALSLRWRRCRGGEWFGVFGGVHGALEWGGYEWREEEGQDAQDYLWIYPVDSEKPDTLSHLAI